METTSDLEQVRTVEADTTKAQQSHTPSDMENKVDFEQCGEIEEENTTAQQTYTPPDIQTEAKLLQQLNTADEADPTTKDHPSCYTTSVQKDKADLQIDSSTFKFDQTLEIPEGSQKFTVGIYGGLASSNFDFSNALFKERLYTGMVVPTTTNTVYSIIAGEIALQGLEPSLRLLGLLRTDDAHKLHMVLVDSSFLKMPTNSQKLNSGMNFFLSGNCLRSCAHAVLILPVNNTLDFRTMPPHRPPTPLAREQQWFKYGNTMSPILTP